MAPNDWIGGPLALEAFLHLHAWHAKYPKDSGNKYCLELNTHSAGVYGIAFELNTVLHHQWRYDTNWVKKLQDFDLLSFYNKRTLCESALQSLGYDPKRLPRKADPGYGHSQLDSSGEADAQAYDAQINALMDGGTPPLCLVWCTALVFRCDFGESEWWLRLSLQCSTALLLKQCPGLPLR